MNSRELTNEYLDIYCEKIPEMNIAYVYENEDGSFSTVFCKDESRKHKSKFVQNLDEIKRVQNLRKNFFKENPEHTMLLSDFACTQYKQKILDEFDKIKNKLDSCVIWELEDIYDAIVCI